MTTKPTAPTIIGSLTPAQARYWNKKAAELAGKVDVIDTQRNDISQLKIKFKLEKGTRVYRASTGGKWGKSSCIVTL